MENSFHVGQNVCYCPEYGKKQNGIIKSLCEDKDYVFVVYHWDGDSSNYQDYTAARTQTKDLKSGWTHQ